MTRQWPLVAVLLLAPALSRAIPACPSTPLFWNPIFSGPNAQAKWPDAWEEPTKKTPPEVLYTMSQALYEQCPRKEAVNTMLETVAQTFIDVTEEDPDREAQRQQSYFWLGMAHAADAETYDRQDNSDYKTDQDKVVNKPGHAMSALKNFVLLTDENLRSKAEEQVRELRLRSARKLSLTAKSLEALGRNYKPAAWQGASQRVKCFLTTYADTVRDKVVHGNLKELNDRARDFIYDFQSDPRYDLAGMRILYSEIEIALDAPKTPENRWPTDADIDPADPKNPRNCYARLSPIPGPEKFDFDFSKTGVANRKRAEQTRTRREALTKQAEQNAASVLDTKLP
jgi:hypothetical protein